MTFQELQPKVTAITLNNSLSRDENFYRFQLLKDNIDYYNLGFTLQIKNLKRCI
jgi:GAF domain-containing protein